MKINTETANKLEIGNIIEEVNTGVLYAILAYNTQCVLYNLTDRKPVAVYHNTEMLSKDYDLPISAKVYKDFEEYLEETTPILKDLPGCTEESGICLDVGSIIEDVDNDLYTILKCKDIYVMFSISDNRIVSVHPTLKELKNVYERDKYKTIYSNYREYIQKVTSRILAIQEMYHE